MDIRTLTAIIAQVGKSLGWDGFQRKDLSDIQALLESQDDDLMVLPQSIDKEVTISNNEKLFLKNLWGFTLCFVFLSWETFYKWQNKNK